MFLRLELVEVEPVDGKYGQPVANISVWARHACLPRKSLVRLPMAYKSFVGEVRQPVVNIFV